MGTESITEDELEAFHQRLQGPLGEALRKTGVILERRMRDRGTSWDDLTDHQVADAFVSAFMEAAPEAYPDVDRRSTKPSRSWPTRSQWSWPRMLPAAVR
jgi:hypothetical protein